MWPERQIGLSCKNTSYTFPTEPTLMAKWIKFLQKHRFDFGEPVSKFTALCLAQFEKDCFAWSWDMQREEIWLVGLFREKILLFLRV